MNPLEHVDPIEPQSTPRIPTLDGARCSSKRFLPAAHLGGTDREPSFLGRMLRLVLAAFALIIALAALPRAGSVPPLRRFRIDLAQAVTKVASFLCVEIPSLWLRTRRKKSFQGRALAVCR